MGFKLDEYERTKSRLKNELLSLKRQSLFFLGISLILIISTVWLSIRLKKANIEIEETNRNLTVKNDSIRRLKDSLAFMAEELEGFRNQVREEKTSFVLTSGMAERIKIAGHRAVSNYDTTTKVFLGNLVYIQDRPASKLSSLLQQNLRKQGAIVPGVETMKKNLKFSNSVRYFHSSDKQMADLLQAYIISIAMDNHIAVDKKNIPVQLIPKFEKKVPPGQFELWLDSL